MVDFTPLFSKKDEIFASLWETYKLDSLSGGWDYIEPALFGYAAGQVVESYSDFYLNTSDHVIAHFHEWMTGAGVLYLEKEAPQIGTIFTTHATSLGRSMAGNSIPFYSELKKIKPTEMAKKLGISSKFSLELNSALYADCFTTVSEITAEECKYFFNKEVDIITPNGFDDSFVPKKNKLDQIKSSSRKNIFKVAEALLNQKIEEDTFLILTSGRYEFANKGLDAFVDMLGKLNKDQNLNRKVLAVVAVPGNNKGPKKAILDNLENPDFKNPLSNEYLTHNIHEPAFDPVIKRILENNLNNGSESKVKVLFVPVYLDGKDGIFNIDYYDFLPAFDLTVFPSFYEPWGYTPLESIAFGIPTITTTLAGFGLWVKNKYKLPANSVSVISRTENNFKEFVDNIADQVEKLVNANLSDSEKTRKEALKTAKYFSWDILNDKYHEAYDIAFNKSDKRSDGLKRKAFVEYTLKEESVQDKPDWKKIYVRTNIPEALHPLKELSMNLWWSWNYDAQELFEGIDTELWEETGHNPVALLNKLSFEELKQLRDNGAFMEKLGIIFSQFSNYMKEAENMPDESVGYFSMEFGLHESLKIYSGGLGILAGDYFKAGQRF